MQREGKMMLEKLHRGINGFHKAFNWRRFRRDALHLGESLLVFGILYGIFSTLIWGVCWIFKINYDPDLVAVAWAVPVLLDTLVNKAYDWNNEVRDWDTLSKVYDRYPEVLCLHMADMIATHIMEAGE